MRRAPSADDQPAMTHFLAALLQAAAPETPYVVRTAWFTAASFLVLAAVVWAIWRKLSE